MDLDYDDTQAGNVSFLPPHCLQRPLAPDNGLVFIVQGFCVRTIDYIHNYLFDVLTCRDDMITKITGQVREFDLLLTIKTNPTIQVAPISSIISTKLHNILLKCIDILMAD